MTNRERQWQPMTMAEVLALTSDEPDGLNDPDDQAADREQSRYERDLTREW